VVREWSPSDKDALVRFANNRNVWRNLTDKFPHPYTAADADWWLTFVAQMAEPTHWAVEVDCLCVGGIGFTRGDGIFVKSGRFGYWLGEPYWGRGIMSVAVKSVSCHVMSNFGLARLEAPVFAWNPTSMRILEKSGFVREGVLRASAFKDGRLIDSVLYALVDETAG
jgi:RimJ/RimL family protein N-acetyltransferase